MPKDSYFAKNVSDVDALRSLLLRSSAFVCSRVFPLAFITAFAFGCHGVNAKSRS